MQQWKPTPAAASELGISKDTLKRKMESRGGFLENKVHYNLGPSKNSAITWNVALVRDASTSVAFRLAISKGCLER